MKKTNFMNKLLSVACLATASMFFAACDGTNPMETQNEIQKEIFSSKDATFEKLDADLAQVDFYACKQTYNAKRCKNFYEKYGAYDTPEIANPLYNDEGDTIQTKDSVDYLQENAMLNITLTGFDLLASAEAADTLEVKFMVKSYSETVLANTSMSPILIDTTDVTTWEEKSAGAVSLARGINIIKICPVVTLKKPVGEDDETLSTDEDCVTVEALGQIKANETTAVSSETEFFNIKWDWYLY